METQFSKPIDSYFPPLNSLDSTETLASSPPNYNPGLSNNLSPWSDSTVPESDLSGYDSFLEETELDDADFEENEYNHLPPFTPFTSRYTQPWSQINDPNSVELPLSLSVAEESKALYPDWSSRPDSTAKPSFMALLAAFKPLDVGAGLSNLGNTCFLNAVMQCFTHTVPLVLGIMSCKHEVPCYVHRVEGFCVLCALIQHVDLSWRCMGRDRRVIYPWTLVNNLNYFSSSFGRYQQEDAHEFLQCFLDKLENCWNESMLNDISSESSNIVKQVFGGRLVSKLRCCNCGHCSDTYEPSIDFSLEIGDADTLSGALDSFTKVEKIEDSETKFTCENCKEQVFVEKQLMLEQTPSVAAFHLKRFKNDGCFVEKIDKFVAFPLELDLLPYTAGCQIETASLKYDLYAVVVHIGFSSNSGHYYCFIRSAPHTWYRMDDEQVIRVEEELVLSQEAYILFYAKEGTPCFSSFYETIKQSVDIVALNTSPKSVLDNVDARTSSPSMPLECQSDGHENSDATDEASTVITERPQEARTDECENKENFMPVPVPSVNNSSVVTPCNDSEPQTQSVLKESNSSHVPEVISLANVVPTTPTRSPSPEIYGENPPDRTFSIPRGHLKSADQVSCKRQLSRELENAERKQACALIKKMPGSRSQQLLAAIGDSISEGAHGKKRSRGTNLLPSSEARNSRHKGTSRSNAASFR